MGLTVLSVLLLRTMQKVQRTRRNMRTIIQSSVQVGDVPHASHRTPHTAHRTPTPLRTAQIFVAPLRTQIYIAPHIAPHIARHTVPHRTQPDTETQRTSTQCTPPYMASLIRTKPHSAPHHTNRTPHHTIPYTAPHHTSNKLP